MTSRHLAHVADVPPAGEGALRCTADGVDIGLFRVGEQLVAWRDVCPHEAAPVCRGKVTGTRLESSVMEYRYGRAQEILRCPWHGWEFDLLTGEHLASGSGARLRSHPIEIRNGKIYDAAGLRHERTLVVDTRRELTERITELQLTPADGLPLPSWAPGAHLELQLPSGAVRHYSLCGDPRDRNTFTIAVLRELEGRGGSAQMHRLSPGDRIAMTKIRNRFPLRPAPRYLFIAAGIGITAVLSMAHLAHRRRDDFDLVYITRQRSSAAYWDSAEGLPGARIICTAEQDRPDIAELISSTTPETVIYGCGPPGMITELHAAGERFDRTVTTEAFAAPERAPAASGPQYPFELIAQRSGTRVQVGAEETILEALNREGIRPPSSCTSGWCGSCETTVLAGSPDHRDTVLTDEEREAAETMMVCVGRSAGPSITLDL